MWFEFLLNSFLPSSRPLIFLPCSSIKDLFRVIVAEADLAVQVINAAVVDVAIAASLLTTARKEDTTPQPKVIPAKMASLPPNERRTNLNEDIAIPHRTARKVAAVIRRSNHAVVVVGVIRKTNDEFPTTSNGRSMNSTLITNLSLTRSYEGWNTRRVEGTKVSRRPFLALLRMRETMELPVNLKVIQDQKHLWRRTT